MSSTSGFRSDIQGLRAVAVLAVLVYHVWPLALPGGYIGVDVFFVISGYLITGLLLREFEQEGTIRLRDFYARRIRRLLPAATATLFATALAALVWMSASEWKTLAQELLASALYVENWLLVQRSVDYLAVDAAPSPVQHFWTLSVEEQFYIFWPLLMLGAGALARRLGWSVRHSLFWTLFLVTAVSFGYGVYISFVDPAPGYFLTTTRIWELGLGGLLALSASQARAPQWLRVWLGWGGLLAVASSAWFYSSRLPFPGYEALLPTLGTAALLFARAGPESALGRTLSTRPMQYFGDISYSLYLWHWPLVVFYPLATGREVATIEDGISIAVLSVVAAHLSKQFVEEPFRHGGRGESLRPYMIGAGLTATLAVSAGLLGIAGEREAKTQLASIPISGSDLQHPGAGALLEGGFREGEVFSGFVPVAGVARLDRGPAYGLNGSSRCIGTYDSTELLQCNYGKEDARKTVAIVGDSHAVHWLPALELVARSEQWRVVGLTKSSCAFTETMVQLSYGGVARSYTECYEWGQAALGWLLEERPDLVIFSHSPRHAQPGAAFDDSQDQIAQGVNAYVGQLESAGIRVAAIRHTPWHEEDVPACMARPGASVDTCSSNTYEAALNGSLNIAAVRNPKLHLIDLQSYFCFGGRCPVVIGGVLVYRDKHHLTATYARSMAPILAREMKESMR